MVNFKLRHSVCVQFMSDVECGGWSFFYVFFGLPCFVDCQEQWTELIVERMQQ